MNKKISKSTALELLVSLIDNSDNYKTRFESLEIIDRIAYKKKGIFKYLENCLLSDENPKVRASAAKLIFKNFLEEGFSSLKWTISYDNSALVLKTLHDLFKGGNEHSINKLKRVLNQRLSLIYGVVSEEALFLLDLELSVNFFNTNYFKIYSSNTVNGVIDGNYMMCAIKNKHIVALNLSNWGLNIIPESISSLSKLKHLILKNNNIETLPQSIGLLHGLRTLDLSKCKITTLPDSLINLHMLKKLSLNRNHKLEVIPQSIIFIAKKYFSKKYIWEGVTSSDAFVLGLLEILTGLKLKRLRDDELILYRKKARHYKINNNGKVTGIYLFHSQLSNLTLIPEQLCSLECLQDLELPNNDIKVIPKSIQKLTMLKRLNLRNNIIEEIPESLNDLKNLNCLKLSGNRIEKPPDWLKFKMDKKESMDDLNGFKRYFFGIPFSEIIRKIPEKNVMNTTDIYETLNEVKDICLVCRDKVLRFNSFICECATIYCQNCARALSKLEKEGWTRQFPFDNSNPMKHYGKLEEKLEPEKKV